MRPVNTHCTQRANPRHAQKTTTEESGQPRERQHDESISDALRLEPDRQALENHH